MTQESTYAPVTVPGDRVSAVRHPERHPASIEASGGVVHWIDVHGTRLRAAHWPRGARGTVLLLNGRADFIEKYQEAVAELQSRGFAVWTLDWRGQGASSRHTLDPLAHHIDRFEDYLDDLFYLLDRHVLPSLDRRPLVLLGHSMGGHVGARAMAQRPGLFARAILCAPMIDVLRGRSAPGWMARALVRLACLRPGQTLRYSPGPARTPNLDRPFEGNKLTNCPDRYAAALSLLRETPGLALGGITWGWLRAALASIDVLRRPGVVARIQVPTLVAIAGKDTVVDNRAIRRFAGALPRGETLVLEGAKHELMREQDRYRMPLWSAIDRFLAPLG